MLKVVKIFIGDIILEAEFLNTPCAAAIAAMLPIDVCPKEWGDEFYFTIPVYMPLDETATLRVVAGDICYWPPGPALAIFFGPTPMSTGTDPVPASEVNLVGRIIGNPNLLKSCKGAKRIRVELQACYT